MMEPASPPDPNPAPRGDWFDRHFYSIVMGLMCCILLTLSLLWLGERRKRFEAESALREATMKLFAAETLLQSRPAMLSDDEDREDQEEDERPTGTDTPEGSR